MELQEVKDLVDDKLERSITLAGEKGAGAWLTALPLQSMGYTLNKQEFRDAICLRYGWGKYPIPLSTVDVERRTRWIIPSIVNLGDMLRCDTITSETSKQVC